MTLFPGMNFYTFLFKIGTIRQFLWLSLLFFGILVVCSPVIIPTDAIITPQTTSYNPSSTDTSYSSILPRLRKSEEASKVNEAVSSGMPSHFSTPLPVPINQPPTPYKLTQIWNFFSYYKTELCRRGSTANNCLLIPLSIFLIYLRLWLDKPRTQSTRKRILDFMKR